MNHEEENKISRMKNLLLLSPLAIFHRWWALNSKNYKKKYLELLFILHVNYIHCHCVFKTHVLYTYYIMTDQQQSQSINFYS